MHASLICKTPHNAQNTLSDAHRHCEFGQWFYGPSMDKFRADPACQRIHEVHKDMHDAARVMLGNHDAEQHVQLHDYERFMDLAIQFKQDVRNYQFQLISQVCTVDQLTGAWNRYAMAMKLTEEMERTQRGGQPCALCMMDLDHFKQVNDTHGHHAGDEVLQAVVGVVREELRSYDSVCRFGGEEFLILLPNTDLAQAEALLNRLREKLMATPVRLPSGQSLTLTASFGVALLMRDVVLEEVLEQSDHALLAAKAQGRNRVCIWDVGPRG